MSSLEERELLSTAAPSSALETMKVESLPWTTSSLYSSFPTAATAKLMTLGVETLEPLVTDTESLEIVSLRPFAINPFGDGLVIEPIDHPMESIMVNPFGEALTLMPEVGNVFNNSLSNGTGTGTDGAWYRKFYISQIVIFPSILMMILLSLLLIYVIVRHLRAIIKLYLSVIFYAFSILFFASQIITMLMWDFVSTG